MGKRGRTKHDGVQIDIYGNPVHVLNVKDIFRVVKCGKCGETVKLSQAKLHLSYGKSINICKMCLKEIDNQRHTHNTSIKIGGTIESYVIPLIMA